MIPLYSLMALLGLDGRAPALEDLLVIVRDGDLLAGIHFEELAGVREQTQPLASAGGARIGSDRVPITAEGIRYIAGITPLVTGSYGAEGEDTSGWKKQNALAYASGTVSPHVSRAILEERARALARPAPSGEETTVTEILRFGLMYEEFGIEMKYVREVILTGEITPVPGTPPFIAGICAIRGEIVSLVDLRVLLSITRIGLTDLNRVIVLTDGKITFGILADSITGMGSVTSGQWTDCGSLPDNIRRYCKGIAPDSLKVLDASELLSDPAMIIEDPEG
jgi:chemotaxis signal transduction protein